MLTNIDVDQFYITQKQFSIISQQIIKNDPNEAGGFLGGKNDTIQAILPVFNQSLGNKQTTFSITSADIQRAHEFFEKHNLDYFGTYHSHPSGNIQPSPQDMTHVQKYLFIVVKTNETIRMAAYRAKGRIPIEIPITVIDDQRFRQLDLGINQSRTEISNDFVSELIKLDALVNNVRSDQVQYPKLPPQGPDGTGDFTTIA